MADEDYGPGHNRYSVDKKAKALLKDAMKRVEHLMDERDGINDDIKDVFNELKSQGFNVTQVRKMITEKRKRDKDPNKYDENEEMLDLYRVAVGLA